MLVTACYSFLTITVPDVFIPCSRIATKVKTNIRGPYSSPATFCNTTHTVRVLDHIQNKKKQIPQQVGNRGLGSGFAYTWGKLIMRTGIMDSISLIEDS